MQPTLLSSMHGDMPQKERDTIMEEFTKTTRTVAASRLLCHSHFVFAMFAVYVVAC